MKQVVENFQVGENYARVGVVHYNKTNVVEMDLIGPGRTNLDVSRIIDGVKYKRGGKTFTGLALKRAQQLFPVDNNGRKQVLILITGNNLFFKFCHKNDLSCPQGLKNGHEKNIYVRRG